VGRREGEWAAHGGRRVEGRVQEWGEGRGCWGWPTGWGWWEGVLENRHGGLLQITIFSFFV
jgi:hypothetical protein